MQTSQGNYVTFILLVIILFTHPIENRPNKNGLHDTKIRNKRNKDNTKISKHFQGHRYSRDLSLQKTDSLFHELFSKDDTNNIETFRYKRWLKRKIRRLKNKYFNRYVSKFRGNRKQRKLFRRWRNKWRNHSDKRKSMNLKQFMSISHNRSFHYENIASFKSLHLKDSVRDEYIQHHSRGHTDSLFAFNVTLSHHITSAEHAKLIIYLSNEKRNEFKGTQPCYCSIQIRTLINSTTRVQNSTTRVQNSTTRVQNSTTLQNVSIKHNAWHSFDITNLVSSMLSHSTLLLITFKYNCWSINNNVSNVDRHGGSSNQNQCILNLNENSSFRDDKNPVIVIFSTKAPSEYSDSSQHGYNYELKYSDTKEKVSSSSSNTFPNFPSFPDSSKDSAFTTFDNDDFRFLSGGDATTSIYSMSRSHRRSKRRARRRGGRNSCRRKELKVDFKRMKWADFILYPRGYQAYQCVGRCYSPISKYLTPTTHAVIQNLVHASQPRAAGRVCCVPTKLKPISILFYDEHMNVDNRDLKGMVVTECGCR